MHPPSLLCLRRPRSHSGLRVTLWAELVSYCLSCNNRHGVQRCHMQQRPQGWLCCCRLTCWSDQAMPVRASGCGVCGVFLLCAWTAMVCVVDVCGPRAGLSIRHVLTSMSLALSSSGVSAAQTACWSADSLLVALCSSSSAAEAERCAALVQIIHSWCSCTWTCVTISRYDRLTV